MHFRPLSKRGRTTLLLAAATLATTAITAQRLGAQAATSTPNNDGFNHGFSVFRVFPDDDGKLQTLPAFRGLNGNNTFFKPFGTNQQTCATCHVPADGFTIHVQTILDKFSASGGTDPLFRLNDTANRPDATPVSESDREQLYSLIRDLGVMRIGIVVPPPPRLGGTAEFDIETQTTSKFGTLPSLTDPQHPGVATISLFRRPLVTNNMRFDSAVLWDGRANITNIRAQVNGAAKTLLLATAPTNVQLDDVARFMLGDFTDQIIDDRSSLPPSHAGYLGAQGARGGTFNLLAFAFARNAPCIHDATGARTKSLTPVVTYYRHDGPGTLTPSTCRPVEPGGPNMTTFKAWLHVRGNDIRSVSRRQIAHGEEVFNTAEMTVPSDIVIPGLTGNKAHCTTCHATNNIGNNPEASFFVRIGSDSVKILKELADAHPETPSLEDFVTRTQELPQYCLRSTAPGAPALADVSCGNYSGTSTIPPGTW